MNRTKRREIYESKCKKWRDGDGAQGPEFESQHSPKPKNLTFLGMLNHSYNPSSQELKQDHHLAEEPESHIFFRKRRGKRGKKQGGKGRGEERREGGGGQRNGEEKGSSKSVLHKCG